MALLKNGLFFINTVALQILGNSLRASIKSQVNLKMEKVEGIKRAEGLRDLIMPLVWFKEEVAGIEDEEAMAAIRSAVHTPQTTKNALYAICFVGGPFLVLFAFLAVSYVRWGILSDQVDRIRTVARRVCKSKAASNSQPTNGSPAKKINS